jgi:signal transduction histidine kinase
MRGSGDFYGHGAEGSGMARTRSRARALGGQVAYGSVESTSSVRAQLPRARPDEGRWTQAESGLI